MSKGNACSMQNHMAKFIRWLSTACINTSQDFGEITRTDVVIAQAGMLRIMLKTKKVSVP